MKSAFARGRLILPCKDVADSPPVSTKFSALPRLLFRIVRLLLRCEPDLDGLLSNASDDLLGAVSYSTLRKSHGIIERQLLRHLHFGFFGADARLDLLLLYYFLAANYFCTLL